MAQRVCVWELPFLQIKLRKASALRASALLRLKKLCGVKTHANFIVCSIRFQIYTNKMQFQIYFHSVFRINFVRPSRCINRIFLGIFYEQMIFGVFLPLKY